MNPESNSKGGSKSFQLFQACDTIAMLQQQGFTGEFDVLKKLESKNFIQHAVRQINQNGPSVIHGGIIP